MKRNLQLAREADCPPARRPEAPITIDGHPLNDADARLVAVAVANFIDNLISRGDPLACSQIPRCKVILNMIYHYMGQ